MKRHGGLEKKFTGFGVLAALFAMLLVGCGGGGSSGTSGTSPDTIPPAVVSITPADGTTDVAVDARIEATFTELIDPGTVNGSTVKVIAGATEVSGTVLCFGNRVTFTPSANWDISNTYTVIFSGGSSGVKDLAGNPLDGDHILTFSTGCSPDTTPPRVIATNPVNGATGVIIDNTMSIKVIFSEAVKNVTEVTYLITVGDTPIFGTMKLNGSMAEFTPSLPLDYGTTYTVTLTTGVTDLAGNALSADFRWMFTTAAAPDLGLIANAGPDQSVSAGSLVRLDGRASFNPDGNPLTYAWTLDSKPLLSAATLSNPSAVQPEFTADRPGFYVISLVVTDGQQVRRDTVTITAAATVGGTWIDWVRLDTAPSSGIGLLPDGRIVYAGRSYFGQGVVGMLNADGSGGGRLAVVEGYAGGLVVQPDGKIVVVGTTYDGFNGNPFLPHPGDNNTDLLLVRYRSDGSLDNSFGEGGSARYDGGFSEEGRAIAMLPDGKIVVVGHDRSNNHLLVLRYKRDGMLDMTFGVGGVMTYGDGIYKSDPAGIAIQPDGKIIVTGNRTDITGKQEVLLLRYNVDGTPDGTFGVNGVVIYGGGKFDRGIDIAIQPDGRIVVVGCITTGNQSVSLLLLRYNPDGTPDRAFGSSGGTTYHSGTGTAVALQPDGRIVIASGDTVSRYNVDGMLDSSFGEGGVVSYSITSFGGTSFHDLALDGKGGILVAGSYTGACGMQTCATPGLFMRVLVNRHP